MSERYVAIGPVDEMKIAEMNASSSKMSINRVTIKALSTN